MTDTHLTAPTRFAEVDGARLAYRRWGNSASAQPPLLMLQHFRGGMDHWDPLMTDGLAEGREVILFNGRGVASSGGAPRTRIEDMADDAAAFVRALGLERIDLLGFSLGGMQALDLSWRHPELVRKLMLLGTGPRGGDPDMEHRVLSTAVNPVPTLEDFLYLFFGRSETAAQAGRDFWERRHSHVDQDPPSSPEAAKAQIEANLHYLPRLSEDDPFAYLRGIQQPTFILNGVHDVMIPTINSFYMARSRPKSSRLMTVLLTKRPMDSNPLNQPLQLPNGSVLRNRLAKAAMSETLGTYDNRPTPSLVALYRRWGGSGLGLIITGNVMIDRRALGEPGNVVIEDESDMPILRQWSEAATAQGSALWAQLNHPGKQSTRGLNAFNLAPSAVPFREDMAAFFETPREASSADIQDIIERFGRSAAICKKAGFDGVQIHGAHGYLINQFLSPHHNRRDDEWGGMAEKRRRFVLAVYAEIRRRVGPDFPVGIKLNSADFQRGGFTEEESLDTIRALAEAGIDLIEISGGTYEAPAMSGAMHEPGKASTVAREAYFLGFAEKARAATRVPLMVTGGFRTAAGMNAALRTGALDVVGLARLLAIDPDAPQALLQGRDSAQRVRPISTGIKAVDSLGIMEVLWYERQLKRIAKGKAPRPSESGLAAFLKSTLSSGWGTMRTRRMR